MVLYTYMKESAPKPRPLTEVLNPRNTPEMGFQSYEALGGDGAYRDKQKSDFIKGDIVNPTLDYPKLDDSELNQGIYNLNSVLSIADTLPDEDVRSAVWDSTSYRMAEMYWLKSSSNLIHTYKSKSPEQVTAMINQTQELNEQLYGKPKKSTSDSVISEVWAQIDSKELVGVAQTIKNELENGVVVTVGDQSVEVLPLGRSESPRLPQIPKELLEGLKAKLYADNADIVELVNSYWRDVILARDEGSQVFKPADMFAVFKAVHALRDPENESGVEVVMEPSAKAMSWDTPTMSVKIGGERDDIGSPETMLGKVFHEYVVHGGRAINGSRTNIPVLGTGLYTEADEGENSDYLTFEEGLAGMTEVAVLNDDAGWKPTNLEKYFGLGLAYEGKDFRQTYETLWRARILLLAKPGEEPTEKSIALAKRNSYDSAVRIFRGTPTEMPRQDEEGEPRVLTYNKDLAYMDGKLQVIEFWDKYGDDPEMVDSAFQGKFDPLNRRQLEIFRKSKKED